MFLSKNKENLKKNNNNNSNKNNNNSNNTNINNNNNNNKNNNNEFKNKWHEKRMYGQFVPGIPEEMTPDLVLVDKKDKIMLHHLCCYTRWLHDKREGNRKDWKISEFEERAETTLVAEKGWSCTSGSRSSGHPRASVDGWTHLVLNWMLKWYKNQSC